MAVENHPSIPTLEEEPEWAARYIKIMQPIVMKPFASEPILFTHSFLARSTPNIFIPLMSGVNQSFVLRYLGPHCCGDSRLARPCPRKHTHCPWAHGPIPVNPLLQGLKLPLGVLTTLDELIKIHLDRRGQRVMCELE